MKMLAVILIPLLLLALMFLAPLTQIMAYQSDTATIIPNSTSVPPFFYRCYLPLVGDPSAAIALTPTTSPTPLLPDLDPFCCDVKNGPCTGDPGSFSGGVRNIGPSDAGEFVVYFQWGNHWQSIFIPGLAANNTKEIFWEFDSSPIYYFLIGADVDDQVAESNELNNEAEWLEPTGTPNPTCFVTLTPTGKK